MRQMLIGLSLGLSLVFSSGAVAENPSSQVPFSASGQSLAVPFMVAASSSCVSACKKNNLKCRQDCPVGDRLTCIEACEARRAACIKGC